MYGLRLTVALCLLFTVAAFSWKPARLAARSSAMEMSNGPSLERSIASMGLLSSLLFGLPESSFASSPAHLQSMSTMTVAAADKSQPTIGSDAPDFSLPSNKDGKIFTLADLKGSRTVLYFYPGDFTQGCTIEAQAFQRDIGKYKVSISLIIS